MGPGAYSLYGFEFQIYLSLVTLLTGQVTATVRHSSLNENSLQASTTSELDILLALEGGSDVDRHFPGGWIEYIQVKARPVSQEPWTVSSLFREVLQKFPDKSGTCRRFTLVIDTDLNMDAAAFYSVCKWLSLKTEGIDWGAYLRTSADPAASQECYFPASSLWQMERRSKTALRCLGRDLPEHIRKARALFATPVNEEAKSTGSPELTLDQACAFLASLTIVTQADLPTMKRQVRASISQYVPHGISVDESQALLHSFAIEMATTRAGQIISCDELLRSIGISHKPFILPEIRAACQELLRSHFAADMDGDILHAAPRRGADVAFEHFLRSPGSRLFVLSGPSRIGKTRQIREWAMRMTPFVPVVLTEAAMFDPERIADDICRAMGHEGRHLGLALPDLIRRASEAREAKEQGYGFVLFIDATDEMNDLQAFDRQLRPLLDGLDSLPIKLVIGCRTSAWEEIRPLLVRARRWCLQPPSEETKQTGEPRLAPSYELLPLTTDERDHALRINSLAIPVNSEALRETLLLPGCLGIYYRLVHSDADTAINADYPVQLYERFWDDVLAKWTAAARKRKKALADSLTAIAMAIRRAGTSDSAITMSELETLDTRVNLQIDSEEQEAPFYEARILGILRDMDERVSFGLPLLLEFALSAALRDELNALSDDATGDPQRWASGIYSEILQHKAEPLAAAFALCIQRLCLEEDERSVPLLCHILGHRRGIDPISMIRNVTDAAAPILATLIRRKDTNWFEARNALADLRTPKSVRELFRLTDHPDETIREQIFLGLMHHPLPEVWVLERLVQLPDDTDSRPQRALRKAIDSLVYEALDLGDQQPLRILEQFLVDDRRHVRLRAARSLGSVGHRSSERSLALALPNSPYDDPEMFRAVSLGLAHQGVAGVAAPLMHLLSSSPPASDDPADELRSFSVWSLGELSLPEAVPIFEQIIRNGMAESFLSMTWAFRGLRRAGAPDVALPYLSDALRGSLRLPVSRFSTPIGDVAALGTAGAQQTLVECLARDAQNPSAQKLWLMTIGNAIFEMDTLNRVEVLTTLHERDLELFTSVEDAAYRLMTENYSPYVPSRTEQRECHLIGKRLLIAIGSNRFNEASSFFLSSQANEDIISMTQLVEDIAVTGNENFLEVLRSVAEEVVPRITASAADISSAEHDHTTISLRDLIDEVAQSVSLIGTSRAFSLYLDILHRHELFRGGVQAVQWFARGIPDLQALFALAEDTKASEWARYQATYTAGSRPEATARDCERLVQLFADPANSELVRGRAAVALGDHGYRAAIPVLREALAALSGTGPSALRRYIIAALCRLGDRGAAQMLITDIKRKRISWSGGDDIVVAHLAAFPRDEDGRDEVDAVLIDLIRNDRYDFRGTAMRAVELRFEQGYLIPGAVEALKDWLQGPREAWLTGTDDQLGPSLLARLDALALCEVSGRISFDNWSETAQEYMIEALGDTGRPEAVEPLLAFLKREKVWLRRAAARGLAKVAYATMDAANRIEEAIDNIMSSPNALEVVRAAEALLWFDVEWADEQLRVLMGHVDRRVRRTAEAVRIHRATRLEASKVFARFQTEPSRSVRWTLAQALMNIGDENTLYSLMPILKEPDARFDPQHALLAQRTYEAIEKRLDELKKKLKDKPLYKVSE